MRLLTLVALILVLTASLLAYYIHEHSPRYIIVPAGEGKAFLLDQRTGQVRLIMGVGSMPVEIVR